MPKQLPATIEAFQAYTWEDIAPFYDYLLAEALTPAVLNEWMLKWSRLNDLLEERFWRIQLGIARDTNNEDLKTELNTFLETIYPHMETLNKQLSEKLVESELVPDNFEVPLKGIRAIVDIFREENIPLQATETQLTQDYEAITGAQTVEWNSEEKTLYQLSLVLLEQDRNQRERAWHVSMQRRLQDREKLNTLWQQLFDNRMQQAKNAEFGHHYRDYMWQLRQRFDYSPDDCLRFHDAIEAMVVPAAIERYEKRRSTLGVETLRPWDTAVDPYSPERLRPFEDTTALLDRTQTIFEQVDATLGGYIKTMRENDLFDLDNRKGKAPGGFSTSFATTRLPFIFMNAVGTHNDVQTMMHEAGHAFHVFETKDWPYSAQRDFPMEFAEVASTTMELLTAPYLSATAGGFYTKEETARARIDHLEGLLLFWPYMAVVDAFQHWVYENPDDGRNPDACDAQWLALHKRFMKGVDWSGLENERRNGWQQRLHIFVDPFYYVEYGLAQLGAIQIWQKALNNPQQALNDYRTALQLGGTKALPELYKTAGAQLTFDAQPLATAVNLVVRTINELEAELTT